MTENKIGTWLLLSIVFFLLSVLFVFTQTASAQGGTEVSLKPLKVNGKEVREYLTEKYQLQKIHMDDLTSTLEETLNGPKGKLHFMRIKDGGITPKRVTASKNIQNHEDRARAIAKAFIKEETSLFGIINMEEIREIRIKTEKGHDDEYTMIRYRRYINNLELDGMYIWIDVELDGRISWISADLVPVPPELYEAVKKKTLIEAEIRTIIEQNLGSFQKDLTGMKISEIRKIAISSPPYVVWVANAGVKSDHGMWGYTVDAFTGEILKRGYVIIH